MLILSVKIMLNKPTLLFSLNDTKLMKKDGSRKKKPNQHPQPVGLVSDFD